MILYDFKRGVVVGVRWDGLEFFQKLLDVRGQSGMNRSCIKAKRKSNSSYHSSQARYAEGHTTYHTSNLEADMLQQQKTGSFSIRHKLHVSILTVVSLVQSAGCAVMWDIISWHILGQCFLLSTGQPVESMPQK